MKLFIVARHKEVIPDYKKEIISQKFIYSKENPDIILSLGGDGTFLISEQKYPYIPKLMIRDVNICNKVSLPEFSQILKQIKEGKYKIDESMKLDCIYQKSILVATNDVIIRNMDQRQAIRFRISVNNIPIRHEHIGDGVVISTPWGSSGYFYSITKRFFKKGIGVGLNNTNTEHRDTINKENSKIDVIITRGDAYLSVDNNKKEFIIKTGDKITIKRHKKDAKIVTLKK